MEQKATVASVLLKLLKQNSVDAIFGVLGDALFPFFDALGKQSDISFYGTSHEANAAFAASYYAKHTGKVGVCVATSGPGTANLINGLADAYFDKTAVLAITGQVETKKIGTTAKQYINQQVLMGAVTKSSELVASIESVIPATAKALATAINEATITHLSIPVDLFSKEVSADKVPSLALQSPVYQNNRHTDSLGILAKALEDAQRPLILLGKACLTQKEAVFRLAERIGAGIVVAAQAKGTIPEGHPLVIGGIGEAYLPEVIAETDCVLLIGTASYEERFLPAGVKLVQIAQRHDNLNYALLTTGVIDEVEQTINSLTEITDKKANRNWRDKIAASKKQLQDQVWQAGENTQPPIHPAHLMTVLKKLLPDDAVIVSDIGSFMHWFNTYFQAEKHTVLTSSHWRSIGCGLPGAIGVSAAQKKRKTVALVGDGGLLLTLGELATASKYQLPILIVVANNHQYNLEKSKMEAQGLAPFGYQIAVPDFVTVTKAFGGQGRTVTEAPQLEDAILEGLKHDGPFVLDVHLQPVALPFIC